MLGMRERLLRGLQDCCPDLVVNGSLTHRIESNLNVSFPGIESEALLMAMPGLAVSTGSACTSTSVEPSYVLTAMGLSPERALSAVRFGLGRFTTDDDIDGALRLVEEALRILRP